MPHVCFCAELIQDEAVLLEEPHRVLASPSMMSLSSQSADGVTVTKQKVSVYIISTMSIAGIIVVDQFMARIKRNNNYLYSCKYVH